MVEAGAGQEDAIVSRPYGKVQRARKRPRAFGKTRRLTFLEHLAATCNVTRAAEAADVTVQCAYQHRRKDAAFRAAWSEALEEGYARLEAMLLERAIGTEPVELGGALVLPAEPFDKDLALHLLREHKKGIGGETRGRPVTRKNAEWSEVEEYFIGKLKALKKRQGRG